jgi:hypothetical protein
MQFRRAGRGARILHHPHNTINRREVGPVQVSTVGPLQVTTPTLNIIQRQLGHASLGTTSIYLQGIDPEEIIAAVRTRPSPTMSASAGLRL